MHRGKVHRYILWGVLSVLVPTLAWGADPVAGTPPVGGAALHVSAQAADFVARWQKALGSPDDSALEALYAPDFVGQRNAGKRPVPVPRVDWLRALRPSPPAPPLVLQISDAQVAGSRKNLQITLRVQWRQGKASGQGRRHMIVGEQGGTLRIRREDLFPGRPGSGRPKDPLLGATPLPLPPIKYRCAWITCPSQPSEQAEVLRECSAACASDATQCAEQAEMLQYGHCGATVDMARAIDLWARSCQAARDVRSCVKAAQRLSDRKGPGDSPRALSLLGCDGPPSARTCNSDLAAQLLLATGDVKQVQRALDIYLSACGPLDSLSGSADDCERAAAIYTQGLLGKPDPGKADELQSQANHIRMEEERRAVEDPRANRHRDI